MVPSGQTQTSNSSSKSFVFCKRYWALVIAVPSCMLFMCVPIMCVRGVCACMSGGFGDVCVALYAEQLSNTDRAATPQAPDLHHPENGAEGTLGEWRPGRERAASPLTSDLCRLRGLGFRSPSTPSRGRGSSVVAARRARTKRARMRVKPRVLNCPNSCNIDMPRIDFRSVPTCGVLRSPMCS